MCSGCGKRWSIKVNLLAKKLDELAEQHRTHGLEPECFKVSIYRLVERLARNKGVSQTIMQLAQIRAMQHMPRALEIWKPTSGRFYPYIVKVCGGALAQKIYESMPPRYAVLILHVATVGGGGHIYSERKRGSLCGAEKRFTQCESEIDFSGFEFKHWLEQNRLHMCQSCLRIYERNERVLHHPVPRVQPANR